MKARKVIFRVQLTILMQLVCSSILASIQLNHQDDQIKMNTRKHTKIVPKLNIDELYNDIVVEENVSPDVSKESNDSQAVRTGVALSPYDTPPKDTVKKRFYNFWNKGWGKTILQLHKDLGYPQDLVQLLEVESLKLSSKTWDDPKLRKKELELPLRIINAFHELDSDTRFKVLTHLRRDQLVHMLVDWRAVIYTSSFNKVVDHILEPYRPGPNLEMILTNLKSRELAILLESSSSFNRVQEILEKLSYRNQIKVLRRFYDRALQKVSMKYAVSFVEILVHHSLPEVRGILLGWMLKDGLEAVQIAGREGIPGNREHLLFMMIASVDHFLEEKNRALLYAQVYQEKLDQFEEEEQKLEDEFTQRLKSQDRLLSQARERLRTSPEYEGIPDYLFEEKLRQIESENTQETIEPEVYQYPSFDKLASDVEEIVDSKVNHRRVLVRIHPAYESFMEYFWHSYPQYRLKRFFHLPHAKLINDKQLHLQRHFMYDDIDGKTTFHFFTKFMQTWEQFRALESHDHMEYTAPIDTEGSESNLKMLVHKPLSKKHSFASVAKKVEDMGGTMHTFVFRGHSYKLKHCIDYIEPGTLLTFIGSCGGFENVRKILSLSPGTHLVLSKGTGTLWINQYFLGELNRLISDGQGIHWPMFRLVLRDSLENHYKNWKRKDELLKIYDKFYLLPHENIGLSMLHSNEEIKRINQMTEARSRGLIAERSTN
ncbi:MAG: hypothetical protein VX619_03125 [bacterium]|nr:hypothetical protein [bacterium]